MWNQRRAALALAGGLTATVIIAGCGSSAGGSGATASSSPAPSSSAAAPSAGTGAADRTTVKIVDFKYAPATVKVAVGGLVTWVNADTTNHTVTGTGGFRLGNVDQGKKVRMRFTKPGTYTYVCDYHPFMKAKVVVTQ